MKLNRVPIAAAIGILIVAGFAIWGVPYWRRQVVGRQDAQARERVSRLLEKGRGREALSLVRLQPRPFRHPDWPGLELHAVTATRDVYALDSLYRRDPEALRRDEDAAILLLRIWLAGRPSPDYAQLRQAWRGRELAKGRWKLLDADALMRAGKINAAAELLKRETLSGADEAGRLLRLALMAAPQDQKAAWIYLSQARAVAPRNPDIRSFCGQFLETAGRLADARVEYVSAALADTANPLLRDQLAEFYRRQGNLDLAAQTWREALAAPVSLDYLWVKALFWSRVVQPPTTALPDSVPGGTLAPLVASMRATSSNRFWDVTAAPEPLNPGDAAPVRPERFWLELLEQLRTGREEEARKMLERAPPAALELQPDLAAALRQILAFRRAGAMPAGKSAAPARPADAPARHAVFDELENLRQVPELTPLQAKFLKSPQIFPAACLAAGWRGAALTLWAEQPLAPDLPEWYVYALAQALRYNRSPDTALALLTSSPSTPLLDLLSAELLIQQRHPDDGCTRLARLASRPDAIGDRAAWLLAVTRLEQGRIEEARAALAQQPRLADSVTGREIEARMEAAAGRTEKAEALYHALAAQSVEARVWLARRAVQRQDWDTARKLTLELMDLMPDELELRRSLLTIDAEARKK